VMFHDIADT